MIGAILVSFGFILTRNTVIRIFTVNPAEIEYAMARLRYAIPFLFLISTYEVVGSALGGMGRSTLPAIVIYYFLQRRKLFGKDSERSALPG